MIKSIQALPECFLSFIPLLSAVFGFAQTAFARCKISNEFVFCSLIRSFGKS